MNDTVTDTSTPAREVRRVRCTRWQVVPEAVAA